MFFIRQIGGNIAAYTPGSAPLRRTVPTVSEVSPIAPPITDQSQHHAPPSGRSAALAAYERVEHPDTPRRRLMLAGELMTRSIVTLRDNTSLKEAYQLVTTQRFRHVPVIDESGKIVGVLSDRDLFRHAAGLGAVSEKQKSAWEDNQVKDIMSQPVLVVTPDTEIREVAQVLFRERIGCMPIVDESYLVVGIITRSDVLRTLITQAPLELWR